MESNLTALPESRLTEAQLCRWLGTAAPGDPLVYHRGFLAVYLDPGNGRLTERERAELRRVSRRAMLLAEDGLAHLLQRRNGPDDFSYLLVARSRPLPGSLTATPGEKVAS